MRDLLLAPLARFLAALVGLIAAPFGTRELLLILGLGLVGYGAALVYWPAGFLAPGVIITGVAIFGTR